VRRHHQVFAHRQAFKDAAALGYQGYTARGDHLRRQARHRAAEYFNTAGARRQNSDTDIHAG
jgi:hypothetical protein